MSRRYFTNHKPQQVFRVALPLHGDLGRGTFDLVKVLRREFDCRRSDILIQAMQLRGAWNRNNPGLLRQQPRKRNLSRCRLLSLGDSGK